MKVRSGSNRRRHIGFTLIELLIVVALIAILSAIAIPFFGDVLSRARRADGKDALLGAQMAEEKFRANCPHYATTMGATDSCVPPTYQMAYSSTSPDGHYSVSIVAATTTTYNVAAVPQGSQSGDKCGTFAVNETGKDSSGTYADDECWKR